MACGVVVVCRVLFALLLVAARAWTYGEQNRAKNAEVPRLMDQKTNDEIRELHKKFFYQIENTPNLKESNNFASTYKVLSSVEGQKLIRSLVDALVPTIGSDNSRELLYHFWQRLVSFAPTPVAKKLLQIETIYGEVDSFPAVVGAILSEDDKFPVVQLLEDIFPQFKIADFLQSFQTDFPQFNITELFYAFKSDSGSDNNYVTRFLSVITPGIYKYLRENNIDLQADAVVQLATSLAAQFQAPEVSGRDKTISDGKKTVNKNLFSMLLPLLSMLGTESNLNMNNIMEHIMAMLNKNAQGNNIMENLMSLLGNANNGQNNLLENLIGTFNNGGGKMGGGMDNNMMSMMMALMGGLGKKKENDNIDMLANVIGLMSGSGDRNEGPDVAGMAKIALNMLSSFGGNGKENKNKKYDPRPTKKPAMKENGKPLLGKISAQEKKVESNIIDRHQNTQNRNQRSRLALLLEPALHKLHTTPSCHAKLEAVVGAAKNMMDTKGMGLKTFLTAAVPVAFTGLPGGPAVLQELSAVVEGIGLWDKDLQQILASVTNEGECLTLSRRAAPHVARLLLLLADPSVQEVVWSVMRDQAGAALEGLGLKHVTLQNWQQILGPLINMGAAGLPLKPLPLLAALQEHLTLLLQNTTAELAVIRGQTVEQVTPLLEHQLGSFLHVLGSAEHRVALQAGRGKACVAQAVCLAARQEGSLRGAFITSYSVVRGLSLVSVSVTDRLTVLRAAATERSCQTEFPCTALPPPTSGVPVHASLDYEDAAHQEL